MNAKTENSTDAELFGMLKQDKKVSEAAFAELYRRYSSRVYAYCRRFLANREDARDVFQETFIRFFQSALTEKEMSNVPAYLLRISRNLCVNYRRSEQVTQVYEDYMYAKPDSQNESKELLNLITITLDLLPQDYKDVFILREYDGLSYNEIAELAGVSIGTVKIRLYRAKKKMRELLQPYLSESAKY